MAERDYEYEDKCLKEHLEYARSHLDGRRSTSSPVCSTCKHFFDVGARTCSAFPRDIPDEIYEGRHDHRTPVSGDHGIQFEAADFSEVEALEPPKKRKYG